MTQEITLTRYSEYRPTGFDCKGLALEDKQDWFVAPCGRNRDSSALEESNFDACLEELGGESESVEIHRFGHWACGWYEIILIDPSMADKAQEIADSLEDYPCLDDEDLSKREYESFLNDWENSASSDFVRMIGETFELQQNTVWSLEEIHQDKVRELYSSLDGETWQDNHVRSAMESAIRRLDRETLARWIKTNRVRKTL